MTISFKTGLSIVAVITSLGLVGCGETAGKGAAGTGTQTGQLTAADAAIFLEQAETELAKASADLERALWVQANFITVDTGAIAAQYDTEATKLAVKYATEAAKFDKLDLDPVTRRKLTRLKLQLVLPAPDDVAKTEELSAIKSKLESIFSTGTYEKDGDALGLGELSSTIAQSRDPAELKEAWEGWRTVSPAMKEDYSRLVEIANEGARDLGFKDVGAIWRSGYDMAPDDFAVEADRLWGQVKPLYNSLQCYVRGELSDHYGSGTMSEDGTIPAHLLGNMWAQSWGNVFDLVKPEGAATSYDLTALLKENKYDAVKMAKAADDFFISMGFEAMPDTFWERSLFVKPEDRDVTCHASAWNIDQQTDLRIKMCTEVNGEDFITVHHEIGHNIYQRAYRHQSFLDRTGAHDGFHEAIGDMIALSITPRYLQEIGLLSEAPSSDADIAILMRQALDKVAFLPFGLMVDKWRWQVFDGTLTPETYNDGWWALRKEYQGLTPASARPADAFDPGAKYHIPANVPYMRYFLAHILQFQFHKAACEQAGHEGPLHTCSVYANKDVGARFKAMMELGQQQPWPEALAAFTGSRQMDASAIIDYFAPLKVWMDEQNKERSCGW